MYQILAVLSLVLSVACADDVLTLTDANFDSRLRNVDIALVKFYAPWCGHCKKLAPEFEKAATILKDNDPPVTLVKVDCTEDGKDVCGKYGVSGYPTLKVFKRGEKAFDYEGPRQADGIVKHMKSKAGPSSKHLLSSADAKKFLANPEHSIIGFFSDEQSNENDRFQQVASALSDDFRFAHTFSAELAEEYGVKNTFAIFRAARLQTKLEPSQIEYTGDFQVSMMKDWVNDNIHGLVGHRTTTNSAQFKTPLVVAFFDVDYAKNPKGSNYWRNRVIKVAKKVEDSGKSVTFAVSNNDDFSHELTEFGVTTNGDKPVVTARNAADEKFVMQSEFSVEKFEEFVEEFLDGKLTPYLKSEPVPASNDAPVKVVVASQFNEIVNDPTKDVLIEFYAPWCGHCKSLAPKYDELAEKLKNEDDIVIAKMDATANDVPKLFDVRGFPTIFFVPKGSKSSPKSYDGAREVKDFINYIARESTSPLKGYSRDGSKVKPKKSEL